MVNLSSTSKMSKKHVIIFLLSALSAASCARTGDKVSAPCGYDSETDCLNGTMIVTLDDKYGLADTSGKEILPPMFDDVFYLTDEVGVAIKGDLCNYFDKSGNRLGETVIDGEVSADKLLDIYSSIRSGQRELWDTILSDYEEFRRYCQSEEATEEAASLMADKIRAALRGIDSPMEKDQRLRFESEQAAHKH